MFQLVDADSYARSPDNTHATLTAVFAAERIRLVHMCAQLTGNAEAAEDLAQETMLEAMQPA